MSCKTLKLKNCEIKGATFQGRRFDFVNKVITNDTFKAKIYNSEGILKTEITGLKSGSVVYFPFTTLETYDKGNYTIRYWAEFHLLGKFNIADEDFKIANSCPNCTTQNQPYPFVLDLGEDIVKFNMSFVYIQIGSGGDIDLTAYLTKEEASETYQPKGNYASANHNHSDKANTDASNIDTYVPQWREKLQVPSLPDPDNDHQELIYIPIESDAWRNIPLTSTNPQWVQITAPFASTLNLIPNAAGREFAGVNTKFRKNGWDGKNIFLRNDSEFDLVLKPTTTTAANTTFYTFEEEQVLEAHAWKLFKIREVGGDFFLVEVVFGGAEFPEGGVEGNILEYDAVDGAKWSGRLTNAETAITAINTRTSSVVDKMLHYWDATAGKWLSSGLNWVSSTLLEFAGRFKIKGLLIDETTDVIQARELKFRNNKLKFARNDGIEKNVLLEDDSVFSFDQFISSYFTDGLTIMRPNQFNQTTYFNWNWYGTSVLQAGQSRIDNNINSILYSSSGATLGRVHGNSIFITPENTFRVFRKFSIETAVTSQRIFVGFSPNWRAVSALPVNTPISSLTQVIAICMESGNSNLILAHNDNTGDATIVNTGFVHDVKYIYEFTLSHDWGETFIKARLRRIDSTTGITNDWTHIISGDYPTYPAVMNPALWCVDALNAATVKVLDYGIIKMERIKFL